MRLRLLSALAATVVLLVAAAPAGAFVILDKSGPQSATNGIVLGPDGNFWVAEEFSGSVVRMSQAGVVLNRYPVGTGPTSVTAGPGGRVWIAVTGAKKLVWIDATAAAPSTHDVPTPSTCGPVAIVAGNNGRMYFSLPSDGTCNGGASQLGAVADNGIGPVQAAQAGGGTVFDLEAAGGKLFAPDFDGGVVRRLSLATLAVESSITITTPDSGPDGVTADGAGNIWITEWNSGKVARFPATQNGGAAQELTPTGGRLINPFGIVAGADGRIYVAGKSSANIARIAVDGSSFDFYFVPDSEPLNIINGTDGDLWFTDQRQTRILRFVNSTPRATTGAATATATTSASLKASVDPRGNETQVVFDYGPTTAYGAASSPVTVPNGARPVDVIAVIAGLTPSTTYHLRVRATNREGSVTGADATFTTPAGIVDADGDGASASTDCNDRDAAILPGAFDRPGDKVDQDCSGKDAAFPELTATANFAFRFGAKTVITRLEITRLRGGETATIRCTGRRCPFKVKTYAKLKKGKRTFGRALFRKRRLSAGATVSVRVTAPLTIGTFTALTVRRSRAAKITRACLQPGTNKPSPCP